IARNKELYQYLRTLTSQPVPGYGGNFLQKWGDDRDQVLTEIFDYIRCVNLRDPVLVAQGRTCYADNGQVAPIQIGATQGFGRYDTISQFGFHFICAQDGADGAVDASHPALKDGERAIEAAFLFTPFSPSLGFLRLAENLTYQVTFQTPLTINGQDLQMPPSSTVALTGQIASGWHNNGREHGGPGGLRGPIQAFGGGGYKFTSKAKLRVKIPAGAATMSFSGGPIQVKLLINNNPIQTFNLNFPGGNFPVPQLVRTGTDDYNPGGLVTTPNYWWTFGGFTPLSGGTAVQGRYSNCGVVPHAPGAEYADAARRWGPSPPGSMNNPGFKKGGIFRAEDVVRSIVPEHGDLRLIAAKSQIAASEFVKVRAAEWESTFRFLHVFVSSAGSHLLYGFANEPGPAPSTDPNAIPGSLATDQLVPKLSYHYSKFPEIRPGAGLKYNLWGDFDNGMANWTDGAYINKPDEGNQATTNSSYTYFAWTYTVPTDAFFSPSRLVPSAGMLGSLPTGLKRTASGSAHAWETLLFRPQPNHPGMTTPKDHLIMDLFWMPIGEPYPISEPFSTAGKINLNYEIAPFSYIRRTTALRGVMKAEQPLVLPNDVSKVCKLWDHDTNDNPYGLPNSGNNLGTGVDIPNRQKWGNLYAGNPPYDQLRRSIDVEKTLAQADARFANGDAFRSATEVCELHLVRTGESLADYQNGSIYGQALATGDNTRERPYANLYANLTTKSNTFNVHMRVQVLRKRPGTATEYAGWNEDLDTVVAEHRGSALIERYVDASDPNLPDFATNTNTTLDNYARFRILSNNKFAP
ncbi:MAG: Verru_Chthon cassette protein A, partial [Chthoniobacteraceae bacterium]